MIWPRRWRLRGSPSTLDLEHATWVVLDVETTGLDTRTDRLLAIGALRVRGLGIALGDSFETVVKPPAPSAAANILVHRIAASEQLAGEAPARAIGAFARFVERPDQPGEDASFAGLVGFHAAFDAAMLRAETARQGRAAIGAKVLDLADLAPALLPHAVPARADLDAWLAWFGLGIAQRHHAVADAMGTACLFLCLLAEARRQGYRTAADLFRLAAAQRWLAGGARH